MLTVLNGDCRELLKTLPDESVHCCVTSPPYWNLRDYSTNGQLGLEQTADEHIAGMVAVFREVRRVMRTDATLWINYGDSYQDKQLVGMPWKIAFALQADGWYLRSEIIWHKPNPMPESVTDRPTKAHEQIFLLAKSSRYFYDGEAIREAGKGTWNNGGYRNGKSVYLENKSFGNSNDELGIAGKSSQIAGRNRRTVWTIATQPYSEAHFATFPAKLVEPCILAGTSARGCCAACGAPWERVVAPTTEYATFKDQERQRKNGGMRSNDLEQLGLTRGTSNKSVSADYATIGWQPTCRCAADVVPCVVLDPFAGSGTVGQVALQLGRRAVLIELNPAYCAMIEKRNTVTYGLPGLG